MTVIYAALGIEARAVRRGWPDADVRVVGMRARRLDRVTTTTGRVLLLGFGGGLEEHQRPGDVVVATSVHDTTGAVELPSAIGILSVLRQAGIAASGGVLWCGEHVVRGAERRHLAGRAQVVDMESARVAAAVGAGRLAVVRVVVDTPRQGFVRACLTGGRRARQVLRDVSAALADQTSSDTDTCSDTNSDPLPTNHSSIMPSNVELAARGTRKTGASNTAGTTEEG